jgi:hypothetical protein
MADMHIAKHSVDKSVIDPVERFIVTVKGRRNRNVRMDDLDALRHSVAHHFKAAEPVPGKFRLDQPLLAVRDDRKNLPVACCLSIVPSGSSSSEKNTETFSPAEALTSSTGKPVVFCPQSYTIPTSPLPTVSRGRFSITASQGQVVVQYSVSGCSVKTAVSQWLSS